MNAVVRVWPPEPLATQAECFAALETMIERGASIDGAGFFLEFDDAPEFGNVTEPCFALTRYVNGKRIKTAHDSLLEAMQALVKP